MNNKKLYLASLFVLTAIVGLFGSITSAVSFKIELGSESLIRPQYIKRNMTPIHFKDKGNDFGGFIYFANGVTSTGDSNDEEIYIETTDQDDAVECMQMIKGFYYNAERGERLRPLDPNTARDWGMDGITRGGIYTRCHGSGYSAEMEKCSNPENHPTEADRENCEMNAAEKFSDSHGYYGILNHIYNGLEFGLIVGTKYGHSTNKGVYVINPLSPSLIRYDNKYPVGFVYDYNGGVGFVGCEILDSKDIYTLFNSYKNSGYDWNSLFRLNYGGTGLEYTEENVLECGKLGSAKNTLISVIVDGLVGMTSNLKGENKNSGIEGNQGNEKMQYFSSIDINNTKLINYARQKAEILCRGRWENYFARPSNPLKSLYCFDGVAGGNSVVEAFTGATIVVKGWDVKVKSMNDFSNDGNYDIFVDNGDLYIDDSGSSRLFIFKKNGFISNNVTTTGDFWNNVHTAWEVGEYKGEEVAAGKFMKGNFIVDGGIKSQATSGLQNVYFIYGKMTSRDTVEELKTTFTRKCNVGTGSDGNPCPISIDGWENPYEGASLVIIDQNYTSPLYN